MKKIMISILTVGLIIISIPFTSKASEDKTVFYLDYGNVSIGDSNVSGYDKSGNLISDINPAGYMVTQTDPKTSLDKSVSVTDGEQKLEIKDINISRKDENGFAVSVLKGAVADITISGINHLYSGTYRAGLDVAIGATAMIGGDGTLYAQSDVEAGIGGGYGRSNGTVVINSGTIYATGGLDGSGAGIGGGSTGKGGNITINGGNVFASGGKFGAGIGGGYLGAGGNITINGGTVTAVGGQNAAGIGGGNSGNGGNIIINGGSVKATAGLNASDIGNGNKCSSAFSGIRNDKGNEVFAVTVPLSNFKCIFLNGIDKTPVRAGHSNDTNLYFYADSEQNIATVYMNDGTVRFINYTKDGYSETLPYLDEYERYEDCLISPDSDNVSVAADYSVEKSDEKYTLKFENIIIDEFLAVEKGDMNRDGQKDGTDAVEAICVLKGMNTDELAKKLADADGNGKLTGEDINLLINSGIFIEVE